MMWMTRIRVFIRTQTNGDRTYLLLVNNERVHGRLVQRVLCRLGRLDELRESGQLDGLLKSLGRFADKMLVLDAHARRGPPHAHRPRRGAADRHAPGGGGG